MRIRARFAATAATILATFLAVAGGGCTVPPLEDLDAKACDSKHPCVKGFCWFGDAGTSGICKDEPVPTVDAGKPDAGPDGGGDAGRECEPSKTEPCSADPAKSGKGECRPGQKTCGSDGTWGPCIGAVEPTEEVCDGKDNDCDELTDELPDAGVLTRACDKQLGVCSGSTTACVDGGWAPCQYGNPDNGEDYVEEEHPDAGTAIPLGLCDGFDNDCDGVKDEGMDEDQDEFGVPGIQCRAAGMTDDCLDTPDAGEQVNPGIPGDECDGLDNNCSGAADESYACVRGSTGVDCSNCADSVGKMTCLADCSGYACVNPPEICNLLDDDCDFDPLVQGSGPDDENVSFESQIGEMLGQQPFMASGAGRSFLLAHLTKSTPAVVTLKVIEPDFSSSNPVNKLKSDLRIPTGGPKAELVGVSRNHLVWVEDSGVGQTRVKAARIKQDAAHQVSAGPAYDALQAPNLRTEVGAPPPAVAAFGEGSIVAIEQENKAAIQLSVLSDSASQNPPPLVVAGSDEIGHPSFGTVGDKLVLYYELKRAGVYHIAWREVDALGALGAENLYSPTPPVLTTDPIIRFREPTGTREAFFFIADEIFTSPTALTKRSIRIVRMSSVTTPDKEAKLYPNGGVSALSVASNLSGAAIDEPRQTTYFAAWLGDGVKNDGVAEGNAIAIVWRKASSSWSPSTTPTGLTSASGFNTITAASDGVTFSIGYDSKTAEPRLFFKNLCPAKE